MLGLVRVTAEVLRTVLSLQGYSTLLSQQTQAIIDLQQSLRELCPVEGPMSAEQLDVASRDHTRVVSGSHAVKISSARAFIDGLGSFVMQTMQGLGEAEVDMLQNSFAELFALLVDGFAGVVAERDANNDAATDLVPAVTPQGLVRMRRAEFASMMIRFKARLTRCGIDEQGVERIEADFNELFLAYGREHSLKAAIDNNDAHSSFEKSWQPVEGRFPDLQDFCGGIATIFPNTARVEADFSTIKREKNLLRLSLSDFSLEGILHASQFELLQTLQETK